MINSFPTPNRNHNFGSLARFLFVPVSWVDTEPEIYASWLRGEYTLTAGKEMCTGLFDKDTAELKMEDASGAKGNIVKSAFTAFLSSNKPEYDELFCSMRCERFIVFCVDYEDNVRVLGRTNAGATFDYAFTTREKIIGTPGYNFKFNFESPCNPPFTSQIEEIC